MKHCYFLTEFWGPTHISGTAEASLKILHPYREVGALMKSRP